MSEERMHSAMDNPVYEEAIVVEVEPQPPIEASHVTFSFVLTFLFKCISHIVNLLQPLAHLWINYYWRTFGDEAVIMPPTPLSFIITSLYIFAEMKSQGSEFPFKTHPRSMNIAITSLLFYGLASAAQHFISTCTRLGPASVYAMVAHSGRIGCLCILVASVASLLYL
ncbi:unnamed protein product [Lactuca virosa]|uniref:Uncharacterized protein n=1 Tax=Lactuca virosa TaxID=75947 RepID=A0AAU9PTR4_9ASTR|nr:unnamed protein product [Lactuca virosa]